MNVFLLIAAALSRVSTALEWTSAATLPNGTRISACVGEKVTLPWAFNITDSGNIIDIEWHYESPEGTSRGIASFIFGTFQPLPTAHQHLGYLPNAGLELNNVTVEDSGTYSVIVRLRGAMDSPAQIVTVEVSDPPVFSGDRLHATLSPSAVFDNQTGQWNIQLSCGNFVSTGQPPVALKWKTPSGSILPSTTQHNGEFTLTVPNPPEDGDYTCFPDNATSSTACVDSASPFHSGATVRVNAIESRLAIMEGRLGALQTENTDLTNEVTELRHVNSNLTNELQDLKQQLQDVITSHPADCADVQIDSNTSGVYTIYLTPNTTLSVYCDMDTDGGGWTVIQRRQDGSADFYRNWHQYERFFGSLQGEFWLGLTNIHRLTSRYTTELRVDLEDFDGSTAYAKYSNFSIAGTSDLYRLHISGYSGTAGDSLGNHKGMQFTTYDRDNDVATYNCAQAAHGGYWYIACCSSNLNGKYAQNAATAGMYWDAWKGYNSLKHVEMKLRPAK